MALITLGYSDSGAKDADYANTANRLYVAKTAAASQNGTLYDSYAYVQQYATNNYVIKMALFSVSGTLLGVSSGLPVDVGTAWEWFHFENIYWASAPSITAETVYYIGIIAGQTRGNIGIDTLAAGTGGYIANSYASPTDFVPGDVLESTKTAIVYIRYTPLGPALKMEGITPEKLEGAAWSTIADVK